MLYKRNPQLNKNGELIHLLSTEGLPKSILTQVLDTAANFVSVAGLVVYSEADLQDLDGMGIAEVLLRTGQPCFVSRYTGEVMFGKKGP